ncbi:uncharacterized protein CDV56_103777 [Aspergillus thermomutatus]|uniref:Uncharacterized protein n=1 Tax=Aspergillus thermomutatus TaxID=41047 RepID=A0A397G3R6_ASPTH|nr:uncharacterized protein CDV56_103777 [Aspergillus thermomutatus]RHZ45595.1 hypothetical protein CDV56_103777 [Aspergillus thermomutatus]
MRGETTLFSGRNAGADCSDKSNRAIPTLSARRSAAQVITSAFLYGSKDSGIMGTEYSQWLGVKQLPSAMSSQTAGSSATGTNTRGTVTATATVTKNASSNSDSQTNGASQPTATSSTLSSNSSSSSTAQHSGLSTGAKAGIGAGVGVDVLILLGLIAFILLRNRRKRTPQETPEARDQSMSLMEYKPELDTNQPRASRANQKPAVAVTAAYAPPDGASELHSQHLSYQMPTGENSSELPFSPALNQRPLYNNQYELPGHSAGRYELQ